MKANLNEIRCEYGLFLVPPLYQLQFQEFCGHWWPVASALASNGVRFFWPHRQTCQGNAAESKAALPFLTAGPGCFPKFLGTVPGALREEEGLHSSSLGQVCLTVNVSLVAGPKSVSQLFSSALVSIQGTCRPGWSLRTAGLMAFGASSPSGLLLPWGSAVPPHSSRPLIAQPSAKGSREEMDYLAHFISFDF